MTRNNTTNEYLERYYAQAEDLNVWFGSGKINLEVAELLLKKYNSSNKRLALQAHEYSKGGLVRKRRINPYHLTLYKHILMFFGLSLECYLKGILIKRKIINPLNADKKSLSSECTRHLSVKMFSLFRKPTDDESQTITRLQRAVFSGKYPIEKNMLNINTYTGYLDQDIKSARKMIKDLQKDWDKLRFVS